MQKMNITTLKQANEFIKNRVPFRASNLMAVKTYYCGYMAYYIYSYATCIYCETVMEEVVINRLDEYFSRSTSRHQSIIKKALNIK